MIDVTSRRLPFAFPPPLAPVSAGQYTAFKVSLGVIIAVLLTFGPYTGFVAFAGRLYLEGRLHEVVGDHFATLRAASIVFALALALLPRLAVVWAPILTLVFGLLNHYCASLTPTLWSYNAHLNLFVAGVAVVETAARWRVKEIDQVWVERLFAFAQVYVAVFYFQSGLAKVVHGGVEWLTTGRAGWIFAIEMGTDLGRRMAEYPLLFPVGSTAIVVFELLFLPLFLTGRFRRFLVLGATGLHLTIWATFDISFWHLWLLYPALFLRDLLPQAETASLVRQTIN